MMDEVHKPCNVFLFILFFPGISLFDDLGNFQLAQINKKKIKTEI